MPRGSPITSYLRYWLDAVDHHSLHSPFLFDFYTKVIRTRPAPSAFEGIEKLREKLLADDRVIEVEDPGSGSSALRGRQGRISDIARLSLSPPKLSTFYHSLVRYFRLRTLVELGTSFGINALYLAQNNEATVHTFEGAPAVADIAEITFEFGGAKNITLHKGRIETTLSRFLQDSGRIDFALLDANHQHDPTLHAFRTLLPRVHDHSVLVIDDIHRSREMGRAWQTIRSHELVYVSLDPFRCGIVFFDPSMSRQHVTLEF